MSVAPVLTSRKLRFIGKTLRRKFFEIEGSYARTAPASPYGAEIVPACVPGAA